jgi:hypothetical protein
MRKDSIFYTITYNDAPEGEHAEPHFNLADTVRLAGIKEITPIEGKEDFYKVNMVEGGKAKDIEIHILSVIAYLDEIQASVETYAEMIRLVQSKQAKPYEGEKELIDDRDEATSNKEEEPTTSDEVVQKTEKGNE